MRGLSIVTLLALLVAVVGRVAPVVVDILTPDGRVAGRPPRREVVARVVGAAAAVSAGLARQAKRVGPVGADITHGVAGKAVDILLITSSGSLASGFRHSNGQFQPGQTELSPHASGIEITS